MPPLRATEALYQSNRRRAFKAMLLARREWAKIDPTGDWFTQWQELLTRFGPVVYAAQIAAATDGSAAVAYALTEAGHPERQPTKVQPKAFAGWVSPSWLPEEDVPLLDYLLTPVNTARNATGSPVDMLAAGGKMLEGLVQFAVTDALAHAHDAQIVATRSAYAVFAEPGSMCQRCAALVGRRYKPGTHLQRHPRCDGVMEAHSERSPYTPEPAKVDRIKDLTAGQRAAIDEGADLNQVLNAKRGGAVSGIYTTEGTTRRGFGYFAIKTRHGAYSKSMDRKLPGKRYASTTVGRLSPETIYKVAKDQADMVRLLRIYGYII